MADPKLSNSVPIPGATAVSLANSLDSALNKGKVRIAPGVKQFLRDEWMFTEGEEIECLADDIARGDWRIRRIER